MTKNMSKIMSMSNDMTNIVAFFSSKDMSNLYMSNDMSRNGILSPGSFVSTKHMSKFIVSTSNMSKMKIYINMSNTMSNTTVIRGWPQELLLLPK